MISNIKYGVMQGRLLPKYKNKFQAFPKNSWFKEFSYAKKIGLDYIEFIFGDKTVNDHPLLSKEGLFKIFNLEKKNNIKVNSVCADYFMYNPLFKGAVEKKIDILKKLLINCKTLNIKDIVIPFVDNSSLDSALKKKEVIKIFNSLSNFLEKININIALETDLNPVEFLEFINRFKSKKIFINYDTGNSAYKKFDILEEFKMYGSKISSIHIKDRIAGGLSVPLGTGDVNFNNFLFCVNKYLKNRDIYFIFQCYRDNEGKKFFEKQFFFFRELIKKYSK